MISLKKVLIGVGLSVAAIALLPTAAPAGVIMERTCRLDASDGTLQDGSRFDLHQFQGVEGQVVTISLISNDFDPYLIVEDPEGERIGEHDDINYEGGNLNALVDLILESNGVYTVYTNSYDSSGFGEYDLEIISVGTPTETVTAAGVGCQ